jgi:ATP-dependent helicase HrpA
VTEGAARLVQAIAAEYQPLIARLNGQPPPTARLKREVEEQLGRLLCKHFVSLTPWERLQHLPRYLKALRLRLEKYPSAPDRDARNTQGVAMLWNRYEQRLEVQRTAGRITPELLEFRWLIEELRVSLFAQELKTPFPVSLKRLDKIWSELG